MIFIGSIHELLKLLFTFVGGFDLLFLPPPPPFLLRIGGFGVKHRKGVQKAPNRRRSEHAEEQGAAAGKPDDVAGRRRCRDGGDCADHAVDGRLMFGGLFGGLLNLFNHLFGGWVDGDGEGTGIFHELFDARGIGGGRGGGNIRER